MLTIAGGILLSILVLLFINPILQIGFILVGLAISILLIYLALIDVKFTLIIASILVPLLVFNNQKAKQREHILDILEKIKFKENLGKITSYGKQLLIGGVYRDGCRQRTLRLKHFGILIAYSTHSESIKIFIQKINDIKFNQHNYDLDNLQLTQISESDLLLLDNDLNEYVENQLFLDIDEKNIALQDDDIYDYFNDANLLNQNGNRVIFFQNIVPQEGIEVKIVKMCIGQLHASAFAELGWLIMKVEIDGETVATITRKKWIELRKNGKLKIVIN